jgi:hypothetical protein
MKLIAAAWEFGVNDAFGSIAGDEETKNCSLRVAALIFFRWQVCIIIGGYFPWNIYNPVQKTGAKIIDVTRSALFLFHQFA